MTLNINPDAPENMAAAPVEPASEREMEEKRKALRLPKPYRVEIKHLSFPVSTELFLETTCSDISAGGLCVEAPQALPKGEKCQVRVHIPRLNKYSPAFFKVHENDSEQYLIALAEVMWVKPWGGSYMMGFRFVDADMDALKALQKLIHKAAAA